MCGGIQSWPFESHPWPPTWAANSLTTELQLQQLVLNGSVIQVMLEARCSHKVCAINSRLHVNTGWSHIKNVYYLRILACRSDFQQFWLTDRLTDRLTDWMADRLKDEYNLVCMGRGGGGWTHLAAPQSLIRGQQQWPGISLGGGCGGVMEGRGCVVLTLNDSTCTWSPRNQCVPMYVTYPGAHPFCTSLVQVEC